MLGRGLHYGCSKKIRNIHCCSTLRLRSNHQAQYATAKPDFRADDFRAQCNFDGVTIMSAIFAGWEDFLFRQRARPMLISGRSFSQEFEKGKWKSPGSGAVFRSILGC